MKYATPIRRNEHGIYVVKEGSKAYPGNVAGYDHVYRMDAAGLKEGDKVHAHHIVQSPIVRIRTPDGLVLHWHYDYNGKPVTTR